MAELTVIGLNHRTAPVEVREQLALPGDLVKRFLEGARDEPALEEALVLATCNRTELYAVARKGHDPLAYLVHHVARLKGAAPVADTSCFYRHDGLAAVRHLLRVTSSLDSQIVGEHQILGQVKDAYHTAVAARTTGYLLNKLMHWAFRTGKRVHTETQLGRGSASVAQAAVELARHIFETLEGKTVLLVGAGQTAECAARALLLCGATRLVVANRTLYRAQQLAYDLIHKTPEPDESTEDSCPDDSRDMPVTCPAVLAGQDVPDTGEEPQAAKAAPATEAVGLEDIPRVIAQADLVITSTGSPDAVLKFSELAETLRRRQRPVVMIDIAVPRDIDPRLATLGNVYLYNIDDLNRLVERNLDRRRQEIPRAEAIIDAEVEEFGRWLASREVLPTIRLLQEHLAALRQAHIERHGKRFSQADREQLERFTESLCSQILHQPMAFLRAMSENGDTGDSLKAAEMVQRLFGLEADAEKEAQPPNGPSPGRPAGE